MNREAIRHEVDRLSQSPELVRSKRLVRFLRFTVDWALDRSGEPLSEYIVGTQVYDREEDFDSLADGIVRAEAHRLRSKLKAHYARLRTSLLTIEYPLGSYVPIFHASAPDFLPQTGKIADAIRSCDWTGPGFGPPALWPQALKSCLAIHLGVAIPGVICWGPEFRLFCNDAMNALLSGAELALLGVPLDQVEDEDWKTLLPKVQHVFERGESLPPQSAIWLCERSGFRQEEHVRVSMSPIPGAEGGNRGVLVLIEHVTDATLTQRRNQTLNDLTSMIHSLSTNEDVYQNGMRILEQNPQDVPFASLYLFDEDGSHARLCRTMGIEAGTAVSPEVIPMGTGNALLTAAVSSGKPEILEIGSQFGRLPTGAWAVPPRHIVVLPLRGFRRPGSIGVLIAGSNPHRLLDADYRGFLEAAALRLSIALHRTRSLERERRHLAELEHNEQTWSAFVSQAEEEFRTPLTVLLGLLDQVLAEKHLPQRNPLLGARRAALRLLNLTGGLIDLMEARTGRLQPAFEAVDLGAITRELADVFAIALARTNLRFTIDCPPASETAYVDRRLWEKLILSLLIHAMQSTHSGEIGISVRASGAWVDTVVWDTGAGIPEGELPQIFEPFHRSESAKGQREHSGVGLALVHQFVTLHGGRVTVESEVGKGSKFSVSIPTGKAHLPQERVVERREQGSGLPALHAYREDSLRWTPEQRLPEPEPAIGGDTYEWQRRELIHGNKRRILVAESDGDLQRYLENVASEMYQVESVSDGEAALASLRAKPADLLLADTNISGIDSLALVRELRGDLSLGSLPIVLISAHTSEEARLRAFGAGVNDYLAKPFTASELLVHLESQLALAETHRQTRDYERGVARQTEMQRGLMQEVLDQLSIGVVVVAASGELIIRNREFHELFGETADRILRLEDLPDPFGTNADGKPLGRNECPLVRAVRFGETITNEWIHYDLPGSSFAAMVSSAPVYTADGTLIGAFASIRRSTSIAREKAARQRG